jgi:minor histocompatibility antigen H13
MFPIFGSISLVSLYMILTYLDESYLNIILTYYFTFIGITILTSMLVLFATYLFGELKGGFKLDFNHEDTEILSATFGYGHMLICSLSIMIGAAYLYSKHWMLNNLFGLRFLLVT